MKKANSTVLAETKYIALIVSVLSVIMQFVFVLIGSWNYKVLLSNIYINIFTVLNFYIMGLFVVKAVEKDEKDAQKVMKTSHSLRTLGLFVAITLGVLLPCFNVFAIIIPLFFPRVAVSLRPIFKNYNANKEGDKDESNKISV